MKKCPFCAEEVQDAAVVCKHCGRELAAKATPPRPPVPAKKKTSPIVIGCLVVFLIFIGLGIVGSLLNPTSRSSQPAGAAASRPAAQAGGVTMANFNKIHEGMSYDEVVKILGSPGEVQSSGEFGGIKTVMYAWKATSGFGNMNAMFQDGRLITKAQFALK